MSELRQKKVSLNFTDLSSDLMKEWKWTKNKQYKCTSRFRNFIVSDIIIPTLVLYRIQKLLWEDNSEQYQWITIIWLIKKRLTLSMIQHIVRIKFWKNRYKLISCYNKNWLIKKDNISVEYAKDANTTLWQNPIQHSSEFVVLSYSLEVS